jgi:phosphoribosylanthranilate isomerase
MTLWIKICGLTTEAGVSAAMEAGADAIGFVFAASKRRVTAHEAARLARGARVPRIAVMQHPQQGELDEVWSVFRPDALQTDIDDLARLRVPADLPIIPVIRAGQHVDGPLPSRVLFEGPRSGTGETADWAAAARLARTTQLVLAGGLTAANVASAIASVRPFGVDVSSGVESAPGVKDPARIHEFVRAARAAAMGAMQ